MNKNYYLLYNFMQNVKENYGEQEVFDLSIVFIKSLYGENILERNISNKKELLSSLQYILFIFENDFNFEIKIVVKNKNKNIFKI